MIQAASSDRSKQFTVLVHFKVENASFERSKAKQMQKSFFTVNKKQYTSQVQVLNKVPDWKTVSWSDEIIPIVLDKNDVNINISFMTQGVLLSNQQGDVVISASELLNEFESFKNSMFYVVVVFFYNIYN